MSETVTTAYVAEKLQCSVTHANLLCRTGKISAIKPFGKWLVDKAAFDAQLGGTDNGTTNEENIDI